MQCIVLAGGLGTRMKRLTATMPKAMIPVVGEPFVRHQLRLLDTFGIDDVVISTGYLGEQIEAEVDGHHPAGMSVRCIGDGPTLLGTAGALRRMADLDLLDEQFMVLYGDSYLLVDYAAVWDQFDPDRYSALMTVLDNVEQLDASNAVFDGDRVVLYRKGLLDPAEPVLRFIDYGLSVLKRDVLTALVPREASYDLAAVFEALSLESKLQGYETTQRFFEIGSETGLADLERLLSGASQ
jgi:NDP-sugar pyrophosphorylase family protein